MILFLLLWNLAQAHSPAPLLKVSRSSGALQESFTISAARDREEMRLDSNYLLLPQTEFGTYARPPSDLRERLKKLKKGPVQKNTLNIHGWKVEVLGEPVSPGDPRYAVALRLINEEAHDKKWQKKDVVSVKLQLPRLKASRDRYAHDLNSHALTEHVTQDLDGLARCQNTFETRLLCRIGDGFIHLPNPDEDKKDSKSPPATRAAPATAR